MAALKRADLPAEVLDLIMPIEMPDPTTEPAGRESIADFETRFVVPVRELAAGLAVRVRLSRRFRLAAQARLDSLVILDSPSAIDATLRRFDARKGLEAAIRYFYISSRSEARTRSWSVQHLVETCKNLHSFVSAAWHDELLLAPSCQVVVLQQAIRQALVNVASLKCLMTAIEMSLADPRTLELALRCDTLGVRAPDLLARVPGGDRFNASLLIVERGADRRSSAAIGDLLRIVAASFPRLRTLRFAQLMEAGLAESSFRTLPPGLTAFSATWHHSAPRAGIAQALADVDKVARAGALPPELRRLRFTAHASTLSPLPVGLTADAISRAVDAVQQIRDNVALLGKTCEARGIVLDVVTIEHTWGGSAWRAFVRPVYP